MGSALVVSFSLILEIILLSLVRGHLLVQLPYLLYTTYFVSSEFIARGTYESYRVDKIIGTEPKNLP